MGGVGDFILCTPYQESVMDLLGTCAVPRPLASQEMRS